MAVRSRYPLPVHVGRGVEIASLSQPSSQWTATLAQKQMKLNYRRATKGQVPTGSAMAGCESCPDAGDESQWERIRSDETSSGVYGHVS
ncbi:hypothetical protein EYC80_004965 [Monilinia laxa]|uniref:Uncharacterized protein n=1 Tax=Monilinia laxa TaxID=61186 RepID=A0A5N6KIF7_MONLA|nr:hypothetical protein EYC80_004965 [Monilinia laxa]